MKKIDDFQEGLDSIIDRYFETYHPDKVIVVKFKSRYRQFLKEFEFNLTTFGIETLIQYFNSWTNKERFGKLEYYSNRNYSAQIYPKFFRVVHIINNVYI
jgi:hypothetical protein